MTWQEAWPLMKAKPMSEWSPYVGNEPHLRYNDAKERFEMFDDGVWHLIKEDFVTGAGKDTWRKLP
jgi:hypothetical protein